VFQDSARRVHCGAASAADLQVITQSSAYLDLVSAFA